MESRSHSTAPVRHRQKRAANHSRASSKRLITELTQERVRLPQNRFKSIPSPQRRLDQTIDYSINGFGFNCGECVTFAATLINAREERGAIHLNHSAN
jgi:hypothetical protein